MFHGVSSTKFFWGLKILTKPARNLTFFWGVGFERKQTKNLSKNLQKKKQIGEKKSRQLALLEWGGSTMDKNVKCVLNYCIINRKENQVFAENFLTYSFVVKSQ